jgi:hypothetical protein
MNRRRHRTAAATAALALSIGTFPLSVRAQAAGGAAGAAATPPPAAAAPAAPAPVASPPAPVTIPQEAYATVNVAAINAFVTPNVANLLNDGDPAGQTKSRDALAQAVNFQGQPASPTFLLEYARAINNAFLPKLDAKAKASIRQRLNMGIVTARVATVAQNAGLQLTTVRLLEDAAEPVVLWGLKASTPQVPLVVTPKLPGNRMPPLVAAIVPAVVRHPSGPVVEEAYAALGGTNDLQVIGELMKLWGMRLQQYQEKVPDDPAVDGKPVFSLTRAETWKALTAEKGLQTKVMQNISDTTAVAAQWADQTQPGDKRDQLVKLVQQCAQGVQVIGINTNDTKLRDAANDAVRLDVKSLQNDRKVLPAVQPALVGEIKRAYPEVKPPPTIGTAAAGGKVAAP